jgi:hypothetical protein
MLKPIDSIEVGMEVAVDVMNVSGMLLIPKGTVLGARHLQMLHNWGIESVNVVDSPETTEVMEKELPEAILRQAADLVEKRFKFISVKIDCVETVRRLAVKQTAQRLFHSDARPPSNA